uniref:RING finger protein 37 isoform X2 n=1 Tax=Pristiophorus japonicus TaxID=55135 RepID=UPI00398F4D8D
MLGLFSLEQRRLRGALIEVCADGYEVSNLISADPTKRSCGFRAESFVIPPIHVTISFPFSVELCRIDVDITAGLQNSMVLQICTSAARSTNMTWNEKSTQGSELAAQAVPDDIDFNCVGYAKLKKQTKVSFRHKTFQPRPLFSEFNGPSAVSDSTLLSDMFNKGQYALTFINHLRIRIIYVEGSILPCLRKLDIWGLPARSTPWKVIENVFRVCRQYKAGRSIPPAQQQNVRRAPNDGLQPGTSGPPAPAAGNIPEEFLDPITSDILVLPMLLPCGKVIDQSTLERYSRCEAGWGRVPNDPFTGVPFGRHSQPEPHPALKARLDHFLLHTAIPDRAVVDRTRVGFVASSAVERESHTLQDVTADSAPWRVSACTSWNVAAASAGAEKRFKAEVKGLQEPGQDLGTVSHEQRLSQSLDSALASALSTFPSFTARQRRQQQEPQPAGGSNGGYVPERSPVSSDEACSSCSKAFSAYSKNVVVYRFLCGHLICKPCLSERQKSSALSCLKCNRTICTRDVVRVHL